MPRLSLLSHDEHKDLRVITRHAAEFGDDVMAVMTFPAEFRSLQAHYPIAFSRSKDGVFTPLALFGFKEKQNLFLDPSDKTGWDAHYVPLMVSRQPFYIGQAPNGKVMQIDLDSPRINRSEGEPLFKEDGSHSDYLTRIGSILATLDQGVSATQPFITAIQEYDLLEAFSLDITLSDGSPHRLAGLYTIEEQRLARLGAEALGKLHEKGHLQAAYMVVASLSNFRDLIARVNQRPIDQR